MQTSAGNNTAVGYLAILAVQIPSGGNNVAGTGANALDASC